MIESFWQKQGDKISWAVVIPANTRARLYVPANDVGNLRENGMEIAALKEIRIVGKTNEGVVIEIGSGSYSFTFDRYKPRAKAF